MNITHDHPLYRAKRAKQGFGKYNGAYYYSKNICKYFIPNIKTDRKWVTVRLPELNENLDHSIVFIHNCRNPNYYEYLMHFKDVICVCSTPRVVDNMVFYGKPILLPLSVDVESIKKYRVKEKTKEEAFAGRRLKMTNRIPSSADILTDMPKTKLLREMAKYKKIYAVGLTALEARVLGCEIGVYDNLYPDPSFWKVVDCKDAAKMLQKMLKSLV